MIGTYAHPGERACTVMRGEPALAVLNAIADEGEPAAVRIEAESNAILCA